MPMDSGAVPVSGHDSPAFSRLAFPYHGVADHPFTGLVDSQLAETCLMFFLLLLLLFFSSSASTDERWFDRHSEGWFWYERIPEPETVEGDQSMTPSPVLPASLSTQWIRKNIGNYLDRAIDEPTKEHVSQYLYLDRFVKEKAERFARVGKQIIESDPMLDENVRRPIAPAAAKHNDDRAFQAKEAALRHIAQQVGLLMYYRGRCHLCKLQAQTLLQLSGLYGFKVMAISTDGVRLSEYPGSKIDSHPPAQLGILSYPALFLLKPPDTLIPLRQGNLPLTTLLDQIIQLAADQHWISSSLFQQTRITNEAWQTLPTTLESLFDYHR